MNASIPTLKAPAPLKAAPGRRMGIHFHVPATPVGTLLLASDNPCIFVQVALGFDCVLRHASGYSDVDFAAHGDFENGLIVFRAPERQWALERALEFFRFHNSFMEIAWRHSLEGAWVYLHPANPPTESFERWLTDEQSAVRDARTETIEETLKPFLQAPPPDEQ